MISLPEARASAGCRFETKFGNAPRCILIPSGKGLLGPVLSRNEFVEVSKGIVICTLQKTVQEDVNKPLLISRERVIDLLYLEGKPNIWNEAHLSVLLFLRFSHNVCHVAG